MAIFQADCPHCGTKKVALAIQHEFKCVKHPSLIWDTLAICGQCSRGVLATFDTPRNNSPKSLIGGGSNLVKLVSMAPTPPDTGAPAYTPDNVARFFRQGKENEAAGHWDAAGAMFRKALDTGLKAKFPEMNRSWSLKKRIEAAAADHKLTPELAEWAHQIRDLGNDAAHDEEPFSTEEAKEMAAFTDLLLQYIFTLPGALKSARTKAGEAAEG